MHAPLTKPAKISFDRRAVMARASALWALAKDVKARGPRDHFGMMAALRAEGLHDHQITERMNADYADRLRVKGITSWADAMRVAWAGERRMVEFARKCADEDTASFSPISADRAERMAIECTPFLMQTTYRARLAAFEARV